MRTRFRAVAWGVRALLALLVAALLSTGLPPAAAQAAGEVLLKLDVSTKGGSALPGLTVSAYPVQHHTIVGDGVLGEAKGGKRYELSLDPAKTWALYFDAPGSATTAFDQFWGGTTWVEEARYWTAADGTSLDITLATNSTLTGTVKGPDGKAAPGVTVYPWRFDGNEWYRLDNAAAVTSSTGVYTMRNLEPGSYKVEFAPANTTGSLSSTSDPVLVGLGATATVNTTLGAGGTISGTVKLFMKDGGVRTQRVANGITAYAFKVEGGGIDTSRVYVSKPTPTSGAWSITGLPADSYKVKLYDSLSADFVDRWVGGTTGTDNVLNAAVYAVTAGKTTKAATTEMDFFGDLVSTSLELVVRDANGEPAPADTTVFLESITGDPFTYMTGDEAALQNGVLQFRFMPVGTYRLWIDAGDGISRPYVGTGHQITAQEGGNTWTVQLQPATAFSYSTPATVSSSSSVVGGVHTVSRGKTTLDDGAGYDQAVNYTYLWLRDGAPIFGGQSATATVYEARGVDQGHRLSVIVKATSFGYPPVFSTVDLGVIGPGAAPVNSTPPRLTAAAATPGSVLGVHPGTWNLAGVGYEYRWMRDGTPIAGATARTYTVQPADVGAVLRVEVIAKKPGHGTSAPVLSDTAVVDPLAAAKQTKAAKVTASSIAGGTRFTATAGTWSPAPSGYTFSWRVDGHEAFSDGTAAKSVFDCTVPACLPTAAIQLRITAARPGAADGVRDLVVRKSGAAPSVVAAGVVVDTTDAAEPELSAGDRAQVGHTLAVTPPEYAYGDAGGGTLTFSYRWERKSGSKWVAIPKATKRTYKVVKADTGKQLRVLVTTKATLGPNASSYVAAGTGSARLELVTGDHPSLTMAGSQIPGLEKRAVVSGGWSVGSVAAKYQWYICDPVVADCSSTASSGWIAAPKATKPSFTPPPSLAGKRLLVQLTGAKSGYQSYAIRSAALTLDAGVAPETTTVFSPPAYRSGISAGSAAIGRTVTVTPAAVDRASGVTREYRWEVCSDAVCASPVSVTITGSTSYTPPASLLDGGSRWLRVRETVRFGSTTVDAGATAIVPLVPGTLTPSAAPKVSTSGTVAVVSPGAWASGVTISYRWYAGTTLVSTASSYDLASAAASAAVRVEVHASRSGYEPAVVRIVVRKGKLPAQPTTLNGNQYGAAIGLSGSINLPEMPTAATVKYQWYQGGKVIKKQTKATYSPSASYIGKSIRLRVTITSPYFEKLDYYTKAVTVAKHAPATGTPTIVSSTGGVAPGAKLTVTPTGYPSGMTYAYTWQKRPAGSSTWTTASTKSSYTVTAADAGGSVRVVVKATRSGWSPSTITSATAPVGYGPALTPATAFQLDGTGAVDTTITASVPWSVAGVTTTYVWKRNGVVIPGATGASVTPTASWIGDEIVAVATGSKAGHQTVTVESDAVRVVAGAAPDASIR